MGVTIVWKGIKPARLRIDRMRLTLLNELKKEGTVHKKELRKTVATWGGAKPKFESLVSLAKGDATVVTGPTGSDEAVNKWMWLDEGTSIRWALMSNDWRSKTRPGRYSSGRGAGRVVIAGKRAMMARNIRPRPGIEARDWSKQLSKDRKRPFKQRMERAMKRASDQAFG